MCRWFEGNLVSYISSPILLAFFRCLLSLLLILSRFSASLLLKKCFKNSLGYLQSGLYSHPTVCCHVTAVRSCSGYWWFALGFPFHSAANPCELSVLWLETLPLLLKNKIMFPVCHLCMRLQHFQLGWAWASQELLLSEWQLWRLANVSPSQWSEHLWLAPWVPAVKFKARENVPATWQTSSGDRHTGICIWFYNQYELTMI